jgi:hypothetical protein
MLRKYRRKVQFVSVGGLTKITLLLSMSTFGAGTFSDECPQTGSRGFVSGRVICSWGLVDNPCNNMTMLYPERTRTCAVPYILVYKDCNGVECESWKGNFVAHSCRYSAGRAGYCTRLDDVCVATYQYSLIGAFDPPAGSPCDGKCTSGCAYEGELILVSWWVVPHPSTFGCGWCCPA